MMTEYIQAAMARARYELLQDGSYYGEIPRFRIASRVGRPLKAYDL